MMNFNKGVDGFRLDVINLISKPDSLQMGSQKLGNHVTVSIAMVRISMNTYKK